MNKKAVSVILSSVIITGIIIIAVLFAYRWGIPIIETNKNLIELEEFTMKFSELKSIVDKVAIEGNLSSRKIDFKVKEGSLEVNPDKDLFKYTINLKSRLCDEAFKFNILLNKTTNIPNGVISLSGVVYETNYTFDNYTRYFIIADSENRWEYDDLYMSSLQEPACFERYGLGDIFITEKNKYGLIFSNVENVSDELYVIFTSTSKKEDNLYHLCGSGGSTTEYSVYLKYKNPISYTGLNCDNVDHFGELDIIDSAFCKSQCSLIVTNKNGKIKIKQV